MIQFEINGSASWKSRYVRWIEYLIHAQDNGAIEIQVESKLNGKWNWIRSIGTSPVVVN